MLVNAGAEVIGYSSCNNTGVRLFDLCGIKDQIIHILEILKGSQPDIVIHMAAQPIVRESYKNPVGTYNTNVMRTVNICEAVLQGVVIFQMLKNTCISPTVVIHY